MPDAPAFSFNTRNHRYTLDGTRPSGVTTILNEGLAKPWLKFWAAKAVAIWAFDHRDAWKDLPRDAAIDLLKREPLRILKSAARRGTAVHGAIAAHALGLDPPDDLTDEEWGYFNAALSYLTEQDVEIVRSENSVYSRTHGYAGSFDLIQRRAGRVEIADFKTSKDVYSDVALQLAGYARADFIGDPESGEELPIPEIEGGMIVQLGADGRYKAVPVVIDDEVFASFLACLAVKEWRQGIESRVLGEPLRGANAAA